MNRHLSRVGALLSIVLIVAACQSSGSLGTIPPLEPTPEPSLGSTPPENTPDPSTPSTPSAPPATAPPGGSQQPIATPAPTPAGTSVVRAYFVLAGDPGSEGLVPYLFEVPKTQAVATAAMQSLLAGAPRQRDGYAQISSAIPAGTKLLGLTIRDGVATVDLSGEFASGGGSASSQYRLAQVVYTLTQFPTVSSVRFMVDGDVVTVFGSEGLVLDGPQARDDFEDQLPAIFVDRPASGAALGNPGRVAGTANVFEASFVVTLLDGEDRVLVEDHLMATCGTGCRGTFDYVAQYNVGRAQWGTLRVWAGSAVDGSPVVVREYPVWLTPAG
ncbi:MAG TPA: GerMN domain-containing protein [Candidatus Limnocylindrales bacterium]|nr:GerMN domain-containing protein [Candidatus Limnocylindrales bacterium]